MAEEAQKKGMKELVFGMVKKNFRNYTMFIALIGIALIFTVLTEGLFLMPRNLSNLFLQTVTIAILSVGMVFVMVAGHIDLSVGFLAGFSGAILAILEVNMKTGTFVAVVVTLLIGILVGAWQGFWIAYKEVPAFIVTLAGMLIFKGALIAVTNGATIGPMSDTIKGLGQGYIPRLLTTEGLHDTTIIAGVLFIIAYIVIEIKNRREKIKYELEVLPVALHTIKIIFTSVFLGAIFVVFSFHMGLPNAIVLLIALIVIFTFIINKTVFGRHVYAIGGNKEASRLSGINIKWRTMTIFIIMGFLSAVAGIVFTGRLNAASASAGNLFELDAIAACVIGGTSTLGGQGTIVGAIIGALVMATLNNGMSLMNVPTQYQFIVKGLILLMAVWIDISSRKNIK